MTQPTEETTFSPVKTDWADGDLLYANDFNKVAAAANDAVAVAQSAADSVAETASSVADAIADIADLATDLTAAEASIESANTNLATLQTTVSELQATVAEQATAIEALPAADQSAPAETASAAIALDDLTDVDVAGSAPGTVLTKGNDNAWHGSHVRMSLGALENVTAPSVTPPNSLLGTVGDGMTAGVAEWEPLHLDYVQQVVLGPLTGQVHDIDGRLALVEGTAGTPPSNNHVPVDLYSGSFTRLQVPASIPADFDVVLASAAGPNGALFADLAAISGSGAVWADFSGALGKVQMPLGTDVHGDTLKQWIRRGTVLTGHKDTSDAAHPVLVIDTATVPTDAGSSLGLNDLKDVRAPADTPAGKVLGTTADGMWGAVSAATVVPPPASATAAGTFGQIAADGQFIYVCTANNTWVRAALATW